MKIESVGDLVSLDVNAGKLMLRIEHVYNGGDGKECGFTEWLELHALPHEIMELGPFLGQPFRLTLERVMPPDAEPNP